TALLQWVMHEGKRLESPESVEVIAQRTAQSVAQLPMAVRNVEAPAEYPVALSNGLRRLTETTRRHH
ncbi:MAG: nicotinate phosphoribosyltransferase, partial [Cyanobacteria bacterium P01_A01_bin.105]